MYMCAASVQIQNILKLFHSYINDKIIFKEVGMAGLGLIGVCTYNINTILITIINLITILTTTITIILTITLCKKQHGKPTLNG